MSRDFGSLKVTQGEFRGQRAQSRYPVSYALQLRLQAYSGKESAFRISARSGVLGCAFSWGISLFKQSAAVLCVFAIPRRTAWTRY